MKEIRIQFKEFWPEFVPEESWLYQMLSRHYKVNIVEEDPDYIFSSVVYGPPFRSAASPAVRIMYSGENFYPDFNWTDYAISSYPIQIYDRAYRHPVCVDERGHCLALESKDRNYPDSILQTKRYFANFITGHESDHGFRGDFFKKLDQYKRVESAGRYLNNMPNGETVSHTNKSKTDFQRLCKFTLCFESNSNRGFITEKITDAFYTDTIPVYYGDPDAGKIFNPKAFINCAEFPDFEAAIQRIIELDNDDEQYLAMLRQPIFNDPHYASKLLRGEEEFLCHIFDQPLEQAYRRSLYGLPVRYSNHVSTPIPEEKKRSLLRRAAGCCKRAIKRLL